jgi:predicted RND superfamily exporter protein
MRRYTDFLFRNRLLILLIVGVISFVCLSFLPSLEINDNFDELALKNDADFQFFQEFLEEFGHDEIIVVAFEAEDILSEENLSFIGELESRLKEVAHVARILSLASATDVRVDGDRIEIVNLVERLPQTLGERDALEQRIRSHPLYYGTLVSEDFRIGAIHLKLDEAISNRKEREDLVRELERILESESGRTGKRLYMAGTPAIAAHVTKQTFRDLIVYLPFTLLLVIGSMFLIFRNYYLTVIPFLAVFLSVLWTIGLLTLITGEINLVTILIPTIIFVIGTSDIVHVLANYQDSVYKAENKEEAIIRTVELSAIPCLMTSLTTMVGFGSMVISDIVPIRQLGVYSAVGIGFAYVVGIVLIPILLSYLRHLHLMEFRTKENPIPGRLKPLLRRVAEINVTKPRIVVGIAIALLLVTYAGFRKLHVDADATNWFGGESEIKKSYEMVNENIGAGAVFYISIEMDDADSVTAPAVLERIGQLEDFLEAQPNVGKVLSLSDVVKYLNFKFNGEDERHLSIPGTQDTVAQLLLMASLSDGEGFLEEFVDPDYRRTVLTVLMSGSDLASNSPTVDQTRTYLKKAFPSGSKTHVTGRGILLTNLHEPLLRGLRNSFLLAFVLIFLMVSVSFRSLKIGLLSMVPNFVPVAFTFGVMGLLDIPLNLFTAPFACIALGIAVDDTVHFLARFQIEFRREKDYRKAIYGTMESVGKALIYTSFIFTAGFCIFLVSGFQVTRNFGALVGFTILGALAADLFLLPVLIWVFKPFGKEKPTEA